MANFLERFQSDPDFEDTRWVYNTEKPFLKHAVVEFAPYDPSFHHAKLGQAKPYLLDPSCPRARVVDEEVPVVIYERNEAASILQQNGWEFILENTFAIEQSLSKKVEAIHKRCLLQFLEEEMPGDPSLKKHWQEIQSTIAKPEEAINRFFKLVGISLATTGLDECCFVGFEFQSGWDQDHGLEVVMHKERVLAAAGMTELMSPHRSIIESVKAIQKYERDPDDFEIV